MPRRRTRPCIGRHFVTPDDVKAVAPAVLAHRLVFGAGVDVAAGHATVSAIVDALAVTKAVTVSRTAPNAERRPPGELTAAGLGMLLLGVYTLAQGSQGEHDGLVAVGAFAFAVFIVGIVWPIIGLRGVDVDVVGPRDATVGDRITLAAADHRAGLAPRGAAARSARGVAAHGRSRRPVSSCTSPTRRGVFRLVRIEVRSGGPLGDLPTPAHALGAARRHP